MLNMSHSYKTYASLDNVKEALTRISPYVHQTPVLTCSTLDEIATKNSNSKSKLKLNFKCENLQKTGAFKARGACNAILMAKSRGVTGIVTHSSGNHGQAVAWASSRQVADLPCTVVVPKGTPQIKCDAIRGYGADLVFCENSPTSRKDTCAKISAETGRHIVHPYDDYDILAGQGTMALEMMTTQKLEGMDAILTTVSGGGMASGISLAAKAINPSIKIILVEPVGKNLSECLKSGERKWPNPPQFLNTIAEGIKTQQLGQLTFPILCDLAEHDVITVTDDEMIEGMRIVAERMKLVIEASAGAVVAAAMFKLSEVLQKWPHIKNIGVVLCGGNTDLNNLPWITKD